MSWLRNTPFSFTRQLSRSLDPRNDYEPQACYNSFCKHWQQITDIILKSQPQHLHDDVLAVVNHLEQLTSLLVLEARAREVNHGTIPASCLEHLLSENLLHKLYEWAVCTGKYENAVRLEQLKLFGNLTTHYSSQVIAAEPFLRPLLKLLSSFRNELAPPNLENQLVRVLNQLSVALMQNIKFIDLFFLTIHAQNGSQAEFIIVRLLLTSVHHEGAVGACARDALLLCAKMSARCQQLADYMLYGNTCPILATGLSGLYSLLPRTLPARVHRLSPDDVNQVHKLTLFIDSVEFCNAVAQVAHPSIKKHLLDLLYQGFLVPVMGPALLQSGAAEQAAATAYLELLLRCVTRGGLLRAVLHYLLTQEYDSVRVVDVLLGRLEGSSQLSLVSLALVETLIDLNSEDVMIELVYKYLLQGHHLLADQRHYITDPECYREASIAFLTLTPECCTRPVEITRKWVDDLAVSGRRVLDYKRDEDPRKINGVQEAIPMNDLVQHFKFNYGNPNETLFGNYHAYLCDARFEIVSKIIACSIWSSKYDSIIIHKREANNNSKEARELDALMITREQDSLTSVGTSGYGTLKTSDISDKEPHSLTSLHDNGVEPDQSKLSNEHHNEGKEHDSLTSVGESSGYESFRYKLEDNDENQCFAEESFWCSFRKISRDVGEDEDELPLIRSWQASAESIIGPLLTSLMKKAASLFQAEVVVNCRVTSVVSKLAALPTPLLTSLLLTSSCVLQSNIPSLYQILKKLKEEVDEVTRGLEKCGELVDKARVFLIQREMALVNARGSAPLSTGDDGGGAPLQVSPSPQQPAASFRRGEPKRRSLSSSFSNMFRLSSSPSQLNSSMQHNSAFNSSPQKRLVFTQQAYWDQSATLRSILNAVILDEWIKELSSLCEEQALRLSAEHYEDDTYIKSVAL